MLDRDGVSGGSGSGCGREAARQLRTTANRSQPSSFFSIAAHANISRRELKKKERCRLSRSSTRDFNGGIWRWENAALTLGVEEEEEGELSFIEAGVKWIFHV